MKLLLLVAGSASASWGVGPSYKETIWGKKFDECAQSDLEFWFDEQTNQAQHMDSKRPIKCKGNSEKLVCRAFCKDDTYYDRQENRYDDDDSMNYLTDIQPERMVCKKQKNKGAKAVWKTVGLPFCHMEVAHAFYAGKCADHWDDVAVAGDDTATYQNLSDECKNFYTSNEMFMNFMDVSIFSECLDDVCPKAFTDENAWQESTPLEQIKALTSKRECQYDLIGTLAGVDMLQAYCSLSESQKHEACSDHWQMTANNDFNKNCMDFWVELLPDCTIDWCNAGPHPDIIDSNYVNGILNDKLPHHTAEVHSAESDKAEFYGTGCRYAMRALYADNPPRCGPEDVEMEICTKVWNVVFSWYGTDFRAATRMETESDKTKWCMNSVFTKILPDCTQQWCELGPHDENTNQWQAMQPLTDDCKMVLNIFYPIDNGGKPLCAPAASYTTYY